MFVICIQALAFADAGAAMGADASADKTVLWVGPPTDFYPRYIADPRRAQTALVLMEFHDREIADTTRSRSSIRFGGRVPFVRFHPAGNPDLGWQVDMEAGFFGQFSLLYGMDNYGWDGVYGLLVSYKPKSSLVYRFGILHDSAHLGDEYVEKTGRERINYSREEIVAGLSWTPDRQWRFYGEVTRDYETKGVARDERLQIGAEYLGPNKLWHGRVTWYSAADINFFAERDWAPATTFQLGWMMPTGQGASRYRLALEVYSGRSLMGEFSFQDESYLGLGIYYDW